MNEIQKKSNLVEVERGGMNVGDYVAPYYCVFSVTAKWFLFKPTGKHSATI